MAAATFTPLEQYLNTTYRPDCDYVDGEVRERNVGILPHSDLLGSLVYLLHQSRHDWKILALPSVRVRVSATRVLVPDVTVIRRSAPVENVILALTLVCCEILSELDTFHSVIDRVADYTCMGVEHIWVIDPISRHAYIATGEGFRQPASGEVYRTGNADPYRPC
jgi:Uma2 family endonuclease